MKAIVVKKLGGPEVLKLEEVTIGKPGSGQVLVRMKASGVNFVDTYQRRGPAFFVKKPSFIPGGLWNPLINFAANLTNVYKREDAKLLSKPPFTPGSEGAGVVEEVGAGVAHFKPGDRVAFAHGIVGSGTYAEKCIVAAESLILLPTDLSFEQGAAFPLQGMTAHYLLFAFRKLQPGDVVLIQAAAGGMGLLLVQWAKHIGAKVIGTVSTEEKAQAARAAGADEVILYTQKDFAQEVMRITQGHGADLIIDGVGRSTFAKNFKAVALRGHIVIYGSASGIPDPIQPISLMVKSVTLCGGMLPNFILTREEMLLLKLTFKTVPLSQAAEAHRLLEGRETMGKVVLSI
jgi:NADPH2:quinone reductase